MSAIVTKQSLQQMLDAADAEKRAQIVGRALRVLFERQTEAEKQSNDTRVNNSIGFASCDAKAGSIAAKYFIKHSTLLPWQMERWLARQRDGKARICRYVRQLDEVAQAKKAQRQGA
jgi:hypothetical protein